MEAKEKRIKLNCPMCNEQFETTRRDKIWCHRNCSDKFRKIKSNIDINYRRQEQMNNNRMHYDYDLNKFFLKEMMPNDYKSYFEKQV